MQAAPQEGIPSFKKKSYQANKKQVSSYMESKKGTHKEADISEYRTCCGCNAWKLASDGDYHMIYTGVISPYGWEFEFQWHCNECWQGKNPKDKEAKKDKGADKDEDKDDKAEEDCPPKKKKPLGTFQPWEDSPPM